MENTINPELLKKELIQYKDGWGGNNWSAGPYPGAHSELIFKPYQLFVRNYMAPWTPHKILYVKHGTGTGKTLTALALAKEYNTLYKQSYIAKGQGDGPGPRIIILGMSGTKIAFRRELFRYTYFGFIRAEEKAQMEALRLEIRGPDSPAEAKYREMYHRIIRRIRAKSKGGFFRFYGYDKFVNLLMPGGQLDENYLASLEGSLVICDEIHNSYNIKDKNTRGVAIYNLIKHGKGMKYLLLSATPMNNSPTEITEMMDFFEPHVQHLKEALFTIDDGQPHLLPGALRLIGDVFRLGVSFLQNVNYDNFPRRIFIGSPIYDSAGELPYLRGTVCMMTQAQTTCALSLGQVVPGEYEEGEDFGSPVPSDGYAIYDIVLPGTDGGVYYKTSDFKQHILLADSSWKARVGLYPEKGNAGQLTFHGPFFELGTLELYSAKYATLVRELHSLLGTGECGKIMIYHTRVNSSGVLMIGEIMSRNGWIEYGTPPTTGTLCIRCGGLASEHTLGGKDHSYTPAIYILCHNEIKKQVCNDLIARFNDPMNSRGYAIGCIIGSNVIRESYDLKALRHIFITSVPPSISAYHQIIGRGVRNDSHAMLPRSMWTVSIHIILHQQIPEIKRYRAKMNDYRVIQEIERCMNEVAIDSDINRSVISEIFDGVTDREVPRFGELYFTPGVLVPPTGAVDRSTFHRYFQEEIDRVKEIIISLFTRSAIWEYGTLLGAVRSPPFRTEFNPSLIDEDSYIIALDDLILARVLQQHGGYYHKSSVSSLYSVHQSPIVKLKVSQLNPTAPGVEDKVTQYIASGDHTLVGYLKSLLAAEQLALAHRFILDASLRAAFGSLIHDLAAIGILEMGSDGAPLGLYIGNTYKTYRDGKWILESIFNIQGRITPNKDGIWVGFFADCRGQSLLKIRKGQFKKETDSRKIPTGIVCSTKDKESLIAILRGLGDKTGALPVHDICRHICDALIEREMAERRKGSTLRWFMGWWSPTLVPN